MIDINILRSIFTLIIFVAFIGMCIWAYSKNRKAEFDEAANIPFQDDISHHPINRGAK